MKTSREELLVLIAAAADALGNTVRHHLAPNTNSNSAVVPTEEVRRRVARLQEYAEALWD